VFRNASLTPQNLKTTQYQPKYTTADILSSLVLKPCATTELQKELKDDLGMSSGTFYTIWLDVKVSEDQDNRWIYTAPA
jgi:hypothetical protein